VAQHLWLLLAIILLETLVPGMLPVMALFTPIVTVHLHHNGACKTCKQVADEAMCLSRGRHRKQSRYGGIVLVIRQMLLSSSMSILRLMALPTP